MLNCKETRPKIVRANPILPLGEVGKELGARWRALSEEQKQAYIRPPTTTRGIRTTKAAANPIDRAHTIPPPVVSENKITPIGLTASMDPTQEPVPPVKEEEEETKKARFVAVKQEEAP